MFLSRELLKFIRDDEMLFYLLYYLILNFAEKNWNKWNHVMKDSVTYCTTDIMIKMNKF